jgi:aromatic ring hydroxylase
MCEANGFDPGSKASLREPMVELIKITEGFFACGVAASVYGTPDEFSGSFMPDPVFANIGKLLLATQIYDMHRLAHEVSGGLIVALPGPDEDHNPATAATLAEVLRANPDVPYDKRIEVARFIEDLTASYQGGWYSVISLHGGGSPAAMKQEIWRTTRSAARSNWSKGFSTAACCMMSRVRSPQPPTRTLLRRRLFAAGTGDHGAAAGKRRGSLRPDTDHAAR